MPENFSHSDVEPLLSASDLAKILGVHRNTVFKAASGHRPTFQIPPGFKVGRLWRWRRKDVDAWLTAVADPESAISKPYVQELPVHLRKRAGAPRKMGRENGVQL